MKKLFATAVFAGALVLLLAACAQAAVADDVQIKSVDNYAGYSNVYTNRPNTTVTITHSNGESWTGTTDSEGKITINAGYTLSKESLKVRLASDNQQATLDRIVVPDNIHDRQAFSFAVPQMTEGEVVNIQTVEGVVVERSNADKYGRVFLAAGLPTGAYLVSRSGHKKPLGQIDIKQRPADALDRPWEHPPQPMQLRNLPQAVKLKDSLSLSGNGFSPNYADMKVNASQVMAATDDQLKLAPLTQLSPGVAKLTVTNMATGQSVESGPVLFYDMQGHLERRKLASGSDQTQLVVNVAPRDKAMKVKAAVVSGPVDLGDGSKEAEVITNNGQAIFHVHAEQGAGPFQLSWELANASLVADDPSNPQEWVAQKAKDCQIGSDESTDNTSVAKGLKEEAKFDQATADKPENWDSDGKPVDKKKFGKFLNEEIARLKKLLKQDGDGNAKDSIKKAIKDAVEAGKAAGLKF